MSRIFFTSDLHFSHKNIAKFCPQFRPVSDVTELDEYMIAQWNACVGPDDVVYNLGDVSFARQRDQIAAVLSRLNGRHHLILGNHDHLIEQQAAYFLNTPKHDGHPLLSSIQHYLKLKLPASKQKVVLFHYPMAEWDGCHHGWYHLYGHLHDRVAPVNGRLLNVGWDLHGRFLSVTDIDQLLSQEPIIQPFL